MANIFDVIPPVDENSGTFILDHGKVVDGVWKYKDDLTSYGWNIRRYNRLKEGALVLSRRPGKLTKDRKFEIYAGGVVTHISEPDGEGNVVATIDHVFKIIPAIKQGDDFIENFQWDSKKKKPNSWEHFWNQYGMNSISFSDFSRLMQNANCVPLDGTLDSNEDDLSEEEFNDLNYLRNQGFKISVELDGKTRKKSEKKHVGIAKKLDFSKLNKLKNRIGALGEEIIFDFLTQKAIKESLRQPKHVSKEEGDGVGYDIIYWNENNEEIYVEVKTTTYNYMDGFEMTQNEIFASQKFKDQYEIYRVYDLNAKTGECKLKIYKGPVDENQFILETRQVRVYNKTSK